MKKQVKIIIGVVVVLAIAIAVASYFFPRPKGDETSGTIGKADKYRQDQMAAKDILLRDDILQDTAAVRKTLSQLIEFSLYSVEVKKVIDSGWIKPLKTNCSNPECGDIITPLQEYSDFINNSLPMMKTTNEMLADCYYNSKKDMSMDVGFQLLNFVNFIDQFLQRDSVFEKAITKMDKYILADKSIDKKHKEQVASLKKIRDKMVIDNLLFAANTGDKKKYEFCSNQVLYNVESVKNIIAATALEVSYIASQTSYSNIGNSPNLNNLYSINLGSFQSNVLIPAASVTQLGYLISSSANTNSVIILNKPTFNNIASNQSLNSYANMPLSNLVNSAANFSNISSGLSCQILTASNLNSSLLNANSDNLGSILVAE